MIAFASCIALSWSVKPVARGTRLCALRTSPVMCADAAAAADPQEPNADQLLLGAMDALKKKDVDLAVDTLARARAQTERERSAPIGSERNTLLALVQARVDAAVATRNLAASNEHQQTAASEATMNGDKAISEVSGAIVRKEFAKAHELLQIARRWFAEAGGTVERDREYVLGNLFASLRAEEERQARVKELLRLKQLAELAKAKKKAKALGVDEDEFEVQFKLKD